MNVWIKSLIDLVYPVEPPPDDLPILKEPFCQLCANPIEGEVDHVHSCHNCDGREWSISQGRSAYHFKDYIRETILGFKYKQQFYHLLQLAEWLEQGYIRFYRNETFDAIVPVPLHPVKKFLRGFNQSEELARILSKKIHVPVLHCIKKTKWMDTQTNYRRNQRIKSQLGAFKATKSVQDMKLLIIDDVMTTGATVDSCARALRKAGAKSVSALTVARG